MRISKSFVKDNLPSHGETIRVNHNEYGCHGDSESCVIRNDGGRISAKCYRCGGWQVIDNDSFSPIRASTVIKKQVALPSDSARAWDVMPSGAKQWLNKAHITQQLANNIGLTWSEKSARLYIPARNIYQQWWVGRSFAPSEPRYKTLATLKDSCFAIAHANKDRLSDRIWIVEDLLSMYRVVEAGNDCMALCTTTISDKGVAMLSKLGYNKATISLDNDNPQVIMANSKIAQRLGWMKDVCRSDLTTDPKYYEKNELTRRL